jgi:hypothetical protein
LVGFLTGDLVGTPSLRKRSSWKSSLFQTSSTASVGLDTGDGTGGTGRGAGPGALTGALVGRPSLLNKSSFQRSSSNVSTYTGGASSVGLGVGGLVGARTGDFVGGLTGALVGALMGCFVGGLTGGWRIGDATGFVVGALVGTVSSFLAASSVKIPSSVPTRSSPNISRRRPPELARSDVDATTPTTTNDHNRRLRAIIDEGEMGRRGKMCQIGSNMPTRIQVVGLRVVECEHSSLSLARVQRGLM